MKNHNSTEAKLLRIAFIVNSFPVISETFIINQIAELVEQGVEVEIFTFFQNTAANVSNKYHTYGMAKFTTVLSVPLGKLSRVLKALSIALSLLFCYPSILFRIIKKLKLEKLGLSLRHIHQIQPLLGKNFDVIHCHFGTVAESFLPLREILAWKTPLVTSLYGYDVSRVFDEQPQSYYDRLKHEGALFFVMSEDMRRRVVSYGFPEEKVKVHPVSIDVATYPYKEREILGAAIELVAVGRFTEKKGFDDLIKALAIVKAQTEIPFNCTLVGGGELEKELRNLVASLNLKQMVDFTGYLPIEKVVELLLEKHLLISPSKTASNGDME